MSQQVRRCNKTKEEDSDRFAAELSAFGWWFASEKFDDSWAMAQLVEALQLTGQVDVDHQVAEKLAGLAALLPGKVVQALNLMVEGDRDGWHVRMWQEHMRAALTTIMECGEVDAGKDAVALVNRLAARGHTAFSDLLPDE